MTQLIPNSGAEREALREKGQFWTPSWVAEAMVAYVVREGTEYIFDPAVGEGSFARALNIVANEKNLQVGFRGREIYESALDQAYESGLSKTDLSGVEICDFLFDDSLSMLPAIVANPPYIRHHRLDKTLKKQLQRLAKRIIGKTLDGRAGYHVFFLIRALNLLAPEGRLAFIVPADVAEGVFADDLWNWVKKYFCIEGVITFEHKASPFPGVDTNPLILLIKNAKPVKTMKWAKCKTNGSPYLKSWVMGNMPSRPYNGIYVADRELEEAILTGLSRPPTDGAADGPRLSDFASIMRGIATGANDFFLFTPDRASELQIPSQFLIPFIGRTRDVSGNILDEETIEQVRQKKRPTLLLSLNGESIENLPKPLQMYLQRGVEMGLHERSLISQRNPWYKMEKRKPPPILFAYLGRRNTRFIRNRAGVVPLTCFLCVYPHNDHPATVDKLWRALNDEITLANLSLVAKSYGGGALKAEPRSLEKLPIPTEVLRKVGLTQT